MIFLINLEQRGEECLLDGSSKYELRAPGFPGYCGMLVNSRVSVKPTQS